MHLQCVHVLGFEIRLFLTIFEVFIMISKGMGGLMSENPKKDILGFLL